MSVRESMPDVPIPLKPEDGVVMLPLQACLTAAYDQGSYRKEIDYAQPPKIPLMGTEADWAKELLQKRS